MLQYESDASRVIVIAMKKKVIINWLFCVCLLYTEFIKSSIWNQHPCAYIDKIDQVMQRIEKNSIIIALSCIDIYIIFFANYHIVRLTTIINFQIHLIPEYII